MLQVTVRQEVQKTAIRVAGLARKVSEFKLKAPGPRRSNLRPWQTGSSDWRSGSEQGTD